MAKRIIISIAIVSIAAPYFALASTDMSIPFFGPLISCSGDPVARDAQGNITGPNPKACTSFCNFIDTGINIIRFVETIALIFLAPILFAWGGIMILVSGANPGSRETGKKILTATAIGVAIILLATVIIWTVVSILGVDLPGFSSALTCVPPA